MARALILLFLVSLGLRLYPVLALHFDGLYGQDSYAYYNYAQQLRDAVTHLQLPGQFYWPLGYPALAALGFTLFREQPFGPQLVSLLTGAAVSILAFLIALETALQMGQTTRFARVAGLIAWAVVAVCGQLIQSSMVIMSDASGLMWASLSAWALLVYARTRQSRWIALAAFAIGWATMTRWQYAGLALPWALYVLLNRPFIFRHAILAAVVGLLTLSSQIVQTFQNPDSVIHQQWLQGWSISNALAHDFVTPADGTFHYDQSPALYYAQPLYFVYYMSPLLVPFLVIGLWLLLRSQRTLLILLLGWSMVEYGFLAGIPYENIRFALAIFPPLAVCVGLGAAWLLTRLKNHIAIGFMVKSAVSLVIVYSLLATLRSSEQIIKDFVAAKDEDLASAQWIAAQIPDPNATVYCLDLLPTMEHYTRLHPVQIYDMTPDTLSRQLQYNQPNYVVFNVETTEHQWVGESPWIIYHWLFDHRSMTEIGTFGNYTLYRVN